MSRRSDLERVFAAWELGWARVAMALKIAHFGPARSSGSIRKASPAHHLDVAQHPVQLVELHALRLGRQQRKHDLRLGPANVDAESSLPVLAQVHRDGDEHLEIFR